MARDPRVIVAECATDAELDFILAAISARSNCTAEVVPALLERSV